MQMFERLLEKLIRENKIDKLDILKKIQSKDCTPQQLIGSVIERSNSGKTNPNVLEERESNQSNDVLLDEHIMAEDDSQDQVDDEDHIAMEARHQTASNNLYKFRNPESERPKTSNGNHRGSGIADDEKLSHAERINQYHKHVEEKKKGSGRPLSGGL